jgi:hypothetical protein
MNTGVAGFTRKTGVFFAYSVDGPEFPPALYMNGRGETVTGKVKN